MDLDDIFNPDNLVGPNIADMYAANLPGLLGQCDAGRTVVAFVKAFNLEDLLGDLI